MLEYFDIEIVQCFFCLPRVVDTIRAEEDGYGRRVLVAAAKAELGGGVRVTERSGYVEETTVVGRDRFGG